MSTGSAHSGSTSEGKDRREFDSDEEYEAFWERLDPMFRNLFEVEAKLEDQVFHVFKDQVHYIRTAEGRASYSDIEMELQRARERKVPSLEIYRPSLVKQQERSVEETELHIAASAGHYENIIQILHRNLDLIASRDSKGDLPLHAAARAGQKQAVMTLTLFMTKIVKPELSIGMANKEGNTALHLAIENGNKEVAWYLILSCPETSQSLNKEGISPLYLAIKTRFRDLVRRMLFEFSFINYLDQPSPKKSIVHIAIRVQDRVILKALLKELHSLVNSFDEEEQTPLHILVNSFDEEGQTPLSYAAYIGYLDGVIFILDMFPDSAFSRNKDGSYPIHKASYRDHVEIVEQFILRFAHTIDLLNGHDQNILHVAAMNGSTKVVLYMLKKQGMKKLMDMRDRDGNTALQLATMNDHLGMVNCLVDARKCHP